MHQERGFCQPSQDTKKAPPGPRPGAPSPGVRWQLKGPRAQNTAGVSREDECTQDQGHPQATFIEFEAKGTLTPILSKPWGWGGVWIPAQRGVISPHPAASGPPTRTTGTGVSQPGTEAPRAILSSSHLNMCHTQSWAHLLLLR